MAGVALLVQQLKYDDDMEDQATDRARPMTLSDLKAKKVEDEEVKSKELEKRR